MAFGFPSPATLWRLARKVEGLFDNQAKQGEALAALQRETSALSDRLTRLEAREEIVVTKAEAAASTAAMGATNVVMSDLARRIGGLEAHVEALKPTQKRLSGDS
ncbi:hypothetical protein [Acidisphaera sp. L21]|uniref:hypothetical protein n=1 Tax=Acidisphaera sp. L21 TaxID=1641851 RepID=UPI00131AE8B6|nr:hypothetical protein [Acidisphaera sp. L21]